VFLYDFTAFARISPYGKWVQVQHLPGCLPMTSGPRAPERTSKIPQPAKGGAVAPAALACPSPLSCCGLAWPVRRWSPELANRGGRRGELAQEAGKLARPRGQTLAPFSCRRVAAACRPALPRWIGGHALPSCARDRQVFDIWVIEYSYLLLNFNCTMSQSPVS
jgi:hypothetical protein